MAKMAKKQKSLQSSEKEKTKKTPKAPERATGRVIFNQIVLFFTIGCVFGTYWEEIMYMVTRFWGTGQLEWVSRRGLLYGPFSPVYGIGAVCIYLIFYRTKMGWVKCFVYGALFGGVLEYVLSVMQEWLFGTISWDYSTYFLNIGGRTTVPYMLVWGALVAVFVQVVYPWIDKLYHLIKPRTANIVFTVLAVFLIFDILISVVATARQSMRRAGDPADNAIEVMLDTVYNDERMRKTYSNAREVKR